MIVLQGILVELPHGTGWSDFKAFNCLSALASIELNTNMAFVEVVNLGSMMHCFSKPMPCSVL